MQEYYLDIDSRQKTDLLKHFSKYGLRKKIVLSDLSEKLDVL